MPYGISFVDGSEYISHKKRRWSDSVFGEDKKHMLPKRSKESGYKVRSKFLDTMRDPKVTDKVLDIYADQALAESKKRLRAKVDKQKRNNYRSMSGMPSVAIKYENNKKIKSMVEETGKTGKKTAKKRKKLFK